jgi:quercetin dioxygenase-like cupin family protein
MSVIPAPSAPTHSLPHARVTSLATPSRGSKETAVWRVVVQPGVAGVPHQLTREEVFVVLAGRARVRIGGHVAEAAAGDAIVVPPNTDFELACATEEEVEAICCFPVGGQARLADGRAFTPPWAE